jgi:hypothetical protein
MSNINQNLLFFNKEGYPYNFTLDSNNVWNGKLFFEPNSTDLYKSLSLYTLEKVKPIQYENTMNIINKEIYNDSGMTLSPQNYTNELVTNILAVNQSSLFYTKWIYGQNFHKKFPKGTFITCQGNEYNLIADGGTDYLHIYSFTVLDTKRNAIMISTTTANNIYNFYYQQSIYNILISSNNCISIPDYNQNLTISFNPTIGEKLSIYGSTYNDGVYQLSSTNYNKSSIFDFDMSSFISGDTISIELNLYTERPLLYSGSINLINNSGILKMTFLNGRNSNISVGSQFICEDQFGNQLLNSNEYTVMSIITKILIGTDNITFNNYSYENDDGTYENIYYVNIPTTFTINLGDTIQFSGSTPNNNIIANITNILTGSTSDILIKTGITVGSNIYPSITLILDNFVVTQQYAYCSIYKVYKEHEQNTVIVTSSIDNSVTSGIVVRCMSITNILTYTQDVPVNGISDALSSFVTKQKNVFDFNGIDIYYLNNILIFEGKYSGQNRYFFIRLYRISILSLFPIVYNTTEILIQQNYSIDISGNTFFYNMIVDENISTYEKENMSKQLSISYHADIVLNIFNDAQDFGFILTLNNVQYYIGFENNSGITSYTLETIKDFINFYGDALYKNGFNISSGITLSGTTILNHLYINGQKPNINVLNMSIKVNKNSSYIILSEIPNKIMLIASNKIYCPNCNFIDIGYSTGMIISIYGSTYPMNNKEFNIIGIDNYYIELSYQGSMESDTNVQMTLLSREYLRKPRESNNIDIYYRYRWDDDTDTSMFFYDISGENLVPWGNNPDYAYTGILPLTLNGDTVIFNTQPNINKSYVNNPQMQQTVFEQLDFKLEKFNDPDISILPKPIQTFIAYKSIIENVNSKILIIERIDNISYSGYSDGISSYFFISGNTLNMYSNNNIDFLELGFKANRYINIDFTQVIQYQQNIHENYDDYLIIDVTKFSITLNATLINFSTQGSNYNFNIQMLPDRIAQFSVWGETEAEDERFKANVKLLGLNVNEDDEYIFKDSDVKEDGIDYRLLNRKRKELLNVYPEIYNYVGSYRAILNSISFFGYDDLQLIEYYRNIDVNSPYYNLLKRVVIPDLLDRTVEGWTYSEDLANSLSYVKTNLFNLTYRITDENGNNVYLYTLKEVQTKLNGLKNWMKRNVIPINSNVRDITGISECDGITWRIFDPCVNITKNVTIGSNEAVNFNYTATRSFNDNWLVSVRFYTISKNIPDFFDLKVITYTKDNNTDILHPQSRFNIFKTNFNNFNFTINWNGENNDFINDHYFFIETKVSNNYGMSKIINKMYKLEDGSTYYYDQFKNYYLVNNNFVYKKYPYIQDINNVYIIDEQGNIYVYSKNSAMIVA